MRTENRMLSQIEWINNDKSITSSNTNPPTQVQRPKQKHTNHAISPIMLKIIKHTSVNRIIRFTLVHITRIFYYKQYFIFLWRYSLVFIKKQTYLCLQKPNGLVLQLYIKRNGVVIARVYSYWWCVKLTVMHGRIFRLVMFIKLWCFCCHNEKINNGKNNIKCWYLQILKIPLII